MENIFDNNFAVFPTKETFIAFIKYAALKGMPIYNDIDIDNDFYDYPALLFSNSSNCIVPCSATYHSGDKLTIDEFARRCNAWEDANKVALVDIGYSDIKARVVKNKRIVTIDGVILSFDEIKTIYEATK